MIINFINEKMNEKTIDNKETKNDFYYWNENLYLIFIYMSIIIAILFSLLIKKSL